MNKRFSIFLAFGLILAGVASRLIPHAPNFTAVGATALFAGAVWKPKWFAIVLPLIILWASDLYLNNGMYKYMFPESYTGFKWMGDYWVYGGFAFIAFLGYRVISSIKAQNVLAGSLLASLSFFLISNLGVWIQSNHWPKNFAGLSACYAFALPYFWNTLAADLLYSTVLFTIYYWLVIREQNKVMA